MSKKIHKISAKDEPQEDVAKKDVVETKVVKSASAEVNAKAAKKAKKAKKPKKPMPTWLKVITWPFRMIFKPFAALGRYIRDSWIELRQVRWPSRKATWKMFFAIVVYAALFMALIALLDMLFTWLFNLIIG